MGQTTIMTQSGTNAVNSEVEYESNDQIMSRLLKNHEKHYLWR